MNHPEETKESNGILQSVGDDILFEPLIKTSGRYYLLIIFLMGIIGWGGYAYFCQYKNGLGVTGLNRPVFWGVYMTNFVFFIGISHAGTLISAILRLTRAEWRRPITRSAEAITVFALCVGAPQVLIDLGRIDRILNIFESGRFGSPLLWDVCSITTYFVGSITYLYLPLIPDLARCRDLPGLPFYKKFFYRIFALGWVGTQKQKHALEVALGFMAVIIIPIAVSVHTVVSWVFSMTIQPMWHTTILGPYFVIGAIFSGIASLIISMAVLRKVLHLEDYFKPIHFNNLGLLLITFCLLWFYATFSEYITIFYGSEPVHLGIFYSKFTGQFAPLFWTMFFLCFIVPVPILTLRRLRTITGVVIASVSINIGMWLERYTIIVPSLTIPRLNYPVEIYVPNWIEISLTAASFAILILLYSFFIKWYPIVSVWEIKGEMQQDIPQAIKDIK